MVRCMSVLSRVTSLNGIYLTGKIKDSGIRADPGAAQKDHTARILKQLTFIDRPGSFTRAYSRNLGQLSILARKDTFL